MSIFRPSARVRLQLRLDEGSDVTALEARLNVDPPTGSSFQDEIPATQAGIDAALVVNQADRTALASVKDALSPNEGQSRLERLNAQRDRLQVASTGFTGDEQLKPLGLEATDPDNRVLLGSITPISCKIQRNGIRAADTCTITIDFKDAPIDPRVTRAGFVDLTIGTVSEFDYQLGVLTKATRTDGSLTSLVQRDDGSETILGSATRFVGFVDDWMIHNASEDGDQLTLKCRDLTAVLIDQSLEPKTGIDLLKPIDLGVKEMINEFVSSAGIRVFHGNPREDGTGNPLPGPVPGASVPDACKARRGAVVRKPRKGKQKMSVWDHIVDVCGTIGLVPLFFNFDLFLIDPQTFWQDSFSVKRMVYGRNLTDLKFARKLNGVKVPTIEVQGYDPSIGKTRWARAPKPKLGKISSGILGDPLTSPPKNIRASKVTPAGAAQDEILRINIGCATSGEQLEGIASSLYEQFGRQEVEGSFVTSELTFFDSEDEGDLLAVQPGQAVEVLVGQRDEATTGDSTGTTVGGSATSIQELQSMSIGRRAEYLQSIGWSERVANRLAEAQEDVSRNSVFKVHSANISWDNESGLEITVGFINFIEVRNAQEARIQGPSDQMGDIIGKSTTVASQALAAASSGSQTNSRRAQEGQISSTEYAQEGTRSNQQKSTLLRTKRQGG